jgi:hypothetical protein
MMAVFHQELRDPGSFSIVALLYVNSIFQITLPTDHFRSAIKSKFPSGRGEKE